MISKLHPYFTLLLFSIANSIFSQQSQFAFTLVRGSKDVTLGKINGITQDTWGYMWFVDAGNSRLIRYDGYSMKIFEHNPSDTNTINVGVFECIAADSSGNVWFPVQGGVDKVTSATGMVTHYKLKIAVGDAIIVDHLGVVWIGGSGGLCALDPKTGKAVQYIHNDKDSTTLSDGTVRVIYEDHEGTIWAGNGVPFSPGSDGGLNKLNRTTGKFTRYINDPADPYSIINNRVRAILEDSKGTFWVGTQGDGLHIMDRKTGTFERLTYDPHHPEKLSRPPVKTGDSFDHITFIKEDVSGKIWIGTYYEGIERYDPLTKKTDHFIGDAKSVSGYPDSTTWTAFTSRDGTLWIATETSTLLYRVDPFRKSITHISTGQTASSFAEDKNGYLWIGTEGNGIFKFDQHNNEVAHFIHNPLDPLSLPENHSMLSAIPGTDKIWSGSHYGIRMIDAQTDKFYKVNSNGSLFEDSLQMGFVSTLEDKAGISSFATWGHGLIRFNPKDRSVKQFLPDPKDSTAISSEQLNHLLEDKQGRLWIIGAGGINRMDRRTEEFKKYLPETFIGSIYQDSKNNIWAGTFKGLYSYNEKDDQFYPFFDAFINISTLGVGGIIEDNDHDIWLTSPSSIIKLNSLTKEFFIYGEKFGIAKNSMDVWAKSLKNKKGQLCFNNDDGFFIFYPEELE